MPVLVSTMADPTALAATCLYSTVLVLAYCMSADGRAAVRFSVITGTDDPGEIRNTVQYTRQIEISEKVGFLDLAVGVTAQRNAAVQLPFTVDFHLCGRIVPGLLAFS